MVNGSNKKCSVNLVPDVCLGFYPARLLHIRLFSPVVLNLTIPTLKYPPSRKVWQQKMLHNIAWKY